jgi:hypothetical protein
MIEGPEPYDPQTFRRVRAKCEIGSGLGGGIDVQGREWRGLVDGGARPKGRTICVTARRKQEKACRRMGAYCLS